MTEVGRTRDAGWQIGVSATVEHPVEHVWNVLTSEAGIRLWLGRGVRRVPTPGELFETSDGTSGEVRSYRDHDRVRLSWRPDGWDHDSTVQVAVQEAGPGRTRVTFHQERLADAEERARQREHWRSVMASLRAAL